MFIRTSGCTRACDFCDTAYHKNGEKMSIKQIVKAIEKSGMDTVVWTGGEPMLWEEEIYEVMLETRNMNVTHHLETNGDILPQSPEMFEYIAFSPKEKRVAINVYSFVLQSGGKWDIKVVTDLKMNKEMIENATILMPLSTYDEKKDKKIQQNVWEYCVKNNIKYAQRIHVNVWGKSVGK